jgi:hypothetical protein
MSPSRPDPRSLQGLPMLTEVIEAHARDRDSAIQAGALPSQAESVYEDVVQAGAAPAAAAPAIDEAQCVERVLGDLHRHTDLMLEYRLREALAPLLARLADSLVRDVRQELAATLRDVVARAVSQELSRRRER